MFLEEGRGQLVPPINNFFGYFLMPVYLFAQNNEHLSSINFALLDSYRQWKAYLRPKKIFFSVCIRKEGKKRMYKFAKQVVGN